MKLLCDEDVERQVVERLRKDGHEVGYVAEEMPSASDERLLERSAVEKAILVTTDKDFGELIFRQRRASSARRSSRASRRRARVADPEPRRVDRAVSRRLTARPFGAIVRVHLHRDAMPAIPVACILADSEQAAGQRSLEETIGLCFPDGVSRG